jgi:hypothetical protein
MNPGYLTQQSATIPIMMSCLFMLFLGSFLGGCAHRALIESDPPGASIRVGHKTVGVTPAEIKVKWVPFKSIPVTVHMPGRRQVELDLSSDLGLMRLGWQALTFQTGVLTGKVPRSTHRALFVRPHGFVGTWNADDVK